jgi:hypothetical protein
MSLLGSLRKKLGSSLADDRGSFKARLPGADGTPWLEMDCGWETHASADGETTRLRAHLRADFARLLGAPQAADGHALLEHSDGGTRRQAIVERGAHLVARGLRSELMQRVLSPLRHRRVDTWMDVCSSTQPLDADGRSLLPARLAELGVQPQADGPPLQSWAGHTPRGMAQVTTLQLDERHLPQGVQGGKPFRLAATFAQLSEDHLPQR